MANFTPDFSLNVEAVQGHCPAGETYATRNMAEGRIPLFSCEGPCIRGEIARLAANMVAGELPPYARACHAEAFFVPHSAMAAWVQAADRCVVIDGCFLQCHGRVVRKLVGAAKVVQFDALPIYRKYTDVFLMDDVPEEERKAVARQVADAIIAKLRTGGAASGALHDS